MSDFFSAFWPLPALAPEAPVAWRGGVALSRAGFEARTAAFSRRLARLKTAAIALYEPDVGEFAALLLAAWSRGMTVTLPGDDLPATRRLLADLPWIDAKSLKSAAEDDATAPFAGDAGLVMLTSGSSGQPCRIPKTLAQLRREVDMLEQRFGALLTPNTRFVASAPHQHMFGLPFALLWPLCTGRPFVCEKIAWPEQLDALPKADYVFVSAPTFLKHLAATPPDKNACARWRLVVAAGSPLADTVSRACALRLDAPVVEIYGSTETGAIACRGLETSPDDRLWQPMPDVRFALEAESARLIVHSPLLSEAERQTGFLSKDAARLDNGRLELLGRVDLIVKVGEKRISRADIENALTRLPEVDAAAVILLPAPTPEERETLAAAVVLTPEGAAQKKRQGKARFDRALRQALRDRLDPLALPRRWRYVSALPVNAMGKTTQGDLARLFAPTLPRASDVEKTEAEARSLCRLALDVPPDLVWFDGHFPELPVLPGVVQIDWAAHFARLHFDLDATRARLSGLKFQQLIRPGDALSLTLAWHPQRRELSFVYRRGGHDNPPCSKGCFHFPPADACN